MMLDKISGGAGGGTRTHTMFPPKDFESFTSAYSITPAYIKPTMNAVISQTDAA